MAFSNSTLKLVILVIVLLATKANSQETVSFDFKKFSHNDTSITLQGSASTTPAGVLSLTDTTKAGPNVGRVLFTNPIAIWDSGSGKSLSFHSAFTFEIVTFSKDPEADGLVFFLIDPTNAAIPENSNHGFLGVIDSNSAFNKFVGVEFDNYVNEWDPPFPHIGIDLNSLYSAKYVKWFWNSGSLVKVDVTYSSTTTTLTVFVTDDDGTTSKFEQNLNLKYLLPERVLFGISGSSGYRQAHNIHSWSFASWEEDSKDIMNAASY
jgi:hypothetical protein